MLCTLCKCAARASKGLRPLHPRCKVLEWHALGAHRPSSRTSWCLWTYKRESSNSAWDSKVPQAPALGPTGESQLPPSPVLER
ncbi:glutamyl-tRNA(Gln) amidotransferase subunit C, mitochondrial-like [Myxocyprinus asiaticus]|uniref:glutamyl-tRNA(Gln) amidotransferase subunit C, mitochondrial-like n=1 Tax=Myxocyprinus asiaticus TaxID=70543 RepID=UPI0022215E61|nr:glutamyl-tRNA(Gln) amidotransferase subunit C, mitochondrial-like [Myxocyprinus asiaticus]